MKQKNWRIDIHKKLKEFLPRKMNIIRKIIIIIIVIIILSSIILFISAWEMGIFASVKITTGERGPYHIVTFRQSSSYRLIYQKIEQIQNNLHKKDIEPVCSAGIIVENPLGISLDKVSAQGGCIIKDSTEIDAPFVLKRIAKRRVLIASIKANPAIAPFKIYPALANQIRKENIKQDSLKKVIELYHNNGLVEIELPIIKE
jgi:hypothetical protein